VNAVGTCSYCGKPWPAYECGKPRKPPVLDSLEPEPATLYEWVQWRTGTSTLSRFHVRLSTSGTLLCGRVVPALAAADSFAPPELRCRQCQAMVVRHEGRAA